jgi:hypothetical protein
VRQGGDSELHVVSRFEWGRAIALSLVCTNTRLIVFWDGHACECVFAETFSGQSQVGSRWEACGEHERVGVECDFRLKAEIRWAIVCVW